MNTEITQIFFMVVRVGKMGWKKEEGETEREREMLDGLKEKKKINL